MNTWFPGATELAVVAVNAQAINAFFTNTTYVGAFSGASDTWYNGWACGLGGTTGACTAVPLPIQ